MSDKPDESGQEGAGVQPEAAPPAQQTDDPIHGQETDDETLDEIEPGVGEPEIEPEISATQPTENPLARAFDVSLLVPDVVEVRMVDASVLSQYEIWIFLASVLSNAVLGFLVAFFQSDEDWSLLATAVVFGILFVAALVTAIVMRRRLRKKSRQLKLQAFESVEGGFTKRVP